MAHHTPFYSHTINKEEHPELYRLWADLFYENGVDLVIQGHSHVFAMSYPVRPDQGPGSYQGFSTDFVRGMLFVGEGTWGSPPRKLKDEKPWTMAQGSFYQFKWHHVYPDHFEVRTVLTQESDRAVSVRDDVPFAIPQGLALYTDTPYGEAVTYPFPQVDTADHHKE